MPVQQNSFTHVRVLSVLTETLTASFWPNLPSVVNRAELPFAGMTYRDQLTLISAGWQEMSLHVY
jgi:hypothetical protein